MNDLENRLNEKINYLCFMQLKYIELNKITNKKYLWRQRGIEEQLTALEELKLNLPINQFDECYEEDLRESEES